MRTTTTLELRPIAELKPYEHNARTHSAEQIEKLRASMREFGFVAPVLITADGGVIAGHGRIEAAALEGFAEAPCVIVDHLTETQRRAYILADNRLAELASWDESLVAAAEKAAAEKAAAEKAAAKVWPLSQRERELISKLGGGGDG